MFILDFLLKYWKWVLYGFAILIILTLIGGFFVRCSNPPIPPADANIEKTKGKIEVTEEQREEANKESKNANEKTKEAESNANNANNIDSANAESNFSTVRPKFCAEFPNDTRCIR